MTVILKIFNDHRTNMYVNIMADFSVV